MATTINNVRKYDETGKPNNVTKDEINIDCQIVVSPLPFKCYGRTTRTSNQELSHQICAAFKTVFHDLVGVMITMPQTVNQFEVEFYFKWNRDNVPDGKIRNLMDLSAGKAAVGQDNYFALMQKVRNASSGKSYALNDETKALLAPFMYGGKDVNAPKNTKLWMNKAQELHVPSDRPFDYRAGEDVVIKVTGFDIHKLLQCVYGNKIITQTVNEKNDEGEIEARNYTSRAHYEIKFAKQSVNSPIFYVNIEQFDEAQVNEIFARENPQMQYNCQRWFS